MCGRRGELILSKEIADLRRAAIEVPGELHLGVANRCDSCEGAREIAFHLVAHGVQLQADSIQGSRRWCRPRYAASRRDAERRGTHSCEEAAPSLRLHTQGSEI